MRRQMGQGGREERRRRVGDALEHGQVAQDALQATPDARDLLGEEPVDVCRLGLQLLRQRLHVALWDEALLRERLQQIGALLLVASLGLQVSAACGGGCGCGYMAVGE